MCVCVLQASRGGQLDTHQSRREGRDVGTQTNEWTSRRKGLAGQIPGLSPDFVSPLLCLETCRFGTGD